MLEFSKRSREACHRRSPSWSNRWGTAPENSQLPGPIYFPKRSAYLPSRNKPWQIQIAQMQRAMKTKSNHLTILPMWRETALLEAGTSSGSAERSHLLCLLRIPGKVSSSSLVWTIQPPANPQDYISNEDQITRIIVVQACSQANFWKWRLYALKLKCEYEREPLIPPRHLFWKPSDSHFLDTLRYCKIVRTPLTQHCHLSAS